MSESRSTLFEHPDGNFVDQPQKPPKQCPDKLFFKGSFGGEVAVEEVCDSIQSRNEQLPHGSIPDMVIVSNYDKGRTGYSPYTKVVIPSNASLGRSASKNVVG